jgi:transposase
MKTRLNTDLPNDIAALKQLVLSQSSELLEHRQKRMNYQQERIDHQQALSKKQARIQFLEEQIILFRHRQFGQSSEKKMNECVLLGQP